MKEISRIQMDQIYPEGSVMQLKQVIPYSGSEYLLGIKLILDQINLKDLKIVNSNEFIFKRKERY